MCKTYDYGNGGKIIAGVIALILAIVAISMDQLSYWATATEDCCIISSSCDDDAYGYCGFKGVRSECYSIEFSPEYSDDTCHTAYGEDDCNKVKSAGATFFSLTIVGCVCYAIGLVFSIPYSAISSYRNFVRFIYMVGGFCFIIGFAVWYADSCQKVFDYDDDEWKYGPSTWLLLCAGIIGLSASVFEFFC